jgi:murein DD-endopeptidase MepM/ murein hydrolase activator NlpD
VAGAAARKDDISSVSATGGETRLRWPVNGRVIAAFGPRADGTHNDGLNLAVPLGTEVHAAEAGLVAYAGSELKGYGNLVLLRHDNGWVTAYAHNDEVLVKAGDKVKRGQVLARAGKTGQVDQPQLHFELRHGSKPVDPTPFLERL